MKYISFLIYLLSLFTLSLSITGCGAKLQRNQPIKIKKNNVIFYDYYTYSQDDQVLNTLDTYSILSKRDDTASNASTARILDLGGSGVVLGGLVAGLWGFSESNDVIYTGAVIGIAVGQIMKIVGNRYLNKAVKTYNKNLTKNKGHAKDKRAATSESVKIYINSLPQRENATVGGLQFQF